MATRTVPLTRAIRCERGTAKYVRDATGALAGISADVAAVDHDADRRSLGVLIEARSENLLLQSQDFTVLPWKTDATVGLVQDTDPGPDNQTPCHRLTLPGGTDGLYQQLDGLVPGLSYTFSVYLRSPGGSPVTVSIGGLDGTNSSNVTVEPGWKRFSITSGVSAASRYPKINAVGQTRPIEVQVWGGMFSEGSHPGSYVRSADAIKVRGADTVISDDLGWLYQGEGTFLIEGSTPPYWQPLPRFLQLHSGTPDENHVDLGYDPGADRVRFSLRLQQNQLIDQSDFGVLARNGDFRLALAYRDNDIAIANGGTVYPVPSGAMVIPRNLSHLILGSYNGESGFLNGWVKRVSYWPRRLTDSRLVEVTQ